MRPCDEGKPCIHDYFDCRECCKACDIDFDGTDCPYMKPWGKKKYREDNGIKDGEQNG